MNLSKFIQNDKRRFPRFETKIPCYLSLSNHKVNGTIMDLSINGAKILPDKDINEFTFGITFSVDNRTLLLKCKTIAKIAECISVEFIDVDKKSKSNLNQILSLIDLGEDII